MNKRERRQEKAYLSAMGGIFEQPGAPADAQSKEVSHYAVKVTEAGLMIDAEFCFYPAPDGVELVQTQIPPLWPGRTAHTAAAAVAFRRRGKIGLLVHRPVPPADGAAQAVHA